MTQNFKNQHLNDIYHFRTNNGTKFTFRKWSDFNSQKVFLTLSVKKLGKYYLILWGNYNLVIVSSRKC